VREEKLKGKESETIRTDLHRRKEGDKKKTYVSTGETEFKGRIRKRETEVAKERQDKV